MPSPRGYLVLKMTVPRVTWPAANKAITRKPRRIVPRHKHHAPPPIHAKPLRPLDRISAEMWEDYRTFKAAGMLRELHRKWAAYLPEPS